MPENTLEPPDGESNLMFAGRPPELLCIGNPLVDVFANADEDDLRRWGLNETVQHIPIEKIREIIEALPEFTSCSGGGAANAAKIAGLLGINTAFTGAIGSDVYGSDFEKELNQTGVLTRLIRKMSHTGFCLILKLRHPIDNDKTTVIAASPSAALELEEGDLDEDMIRSAKVVVLDGYMLGREALVRRIFSIADKYGTVVALDLSTASLAEERAHEFLTYTRAYPVILFMNETEAKAFHRALKQSRKEKSEEDDEGGSLSQELITLFKNFTSNDIFPILAVKLGSKGAMVFAGGNMYKESTIPIKPVNTTGAGDAFSAAFLGAWIREKSLSDCAALGNKAAREVLGAHGSHADPKALKSLGKQLKQK
ncbi:MAG: adenosine kinase [Treponema sp.]|jgi:fructokinase|nr:adenosine kinase [Treponema sp.]